jgi:hypothetical protein
MRNSKIPLGSLTLAMKGREKEGGRIPTKQGHNRIWHLYGIVNERHMLLPYEPHAKNETLKYKETIWLSHMPLPHGSQAAR